MYQIHLRITPGQQPVKIGVNPLIHVIFLTNNSSTMGNIFSTPETQITQRKVKKCILKANSELVAEEKIKNKENFRQSWNDSEVFMECLPFSFVFLVNPSGQSYAMQILPEELWMKIFSELESFHDILLCSRACNYFHDILKDKVSKELFGEVFSFLLPLLDPTDILNCRLVCKQWNEIVDKLLTPLHYSSSCSENCNQQDYREYCLKSRKIYRKFKPYVFVYAYFLTSCWKGHRVHNMNLWSMRHHERNPFVNKQICLVEETLILGSFAEWIEQIPLALGDYVDQVHLVYLAITSSPYTIYLTLIQILRDFKNLKSLKVDFPIIEWTEQAGLVSYWLNLKATPVPVKGTEFVECVLAGDSMGARLTQEWLLRGYHNTLKYIQCTDWLLEYTNYRWPNLCWLHISEVNSVHLFECLRCTDAPKLCTLALKVKINGNNILELIDIVKRFVSLNHLVLTVTSCRAVFKRKMLHYPSIPHFSSSLSTLEIKGNIVKFRDFDFLLFFPFIREIYLENVYCTRTRVNRNAVIDLAEYLAEVSNQGWLILYNSNIWDILPFLKLLSVLRDGGEVSKNFTRSGMEWCRSNT